MPQSEKPRINLVVAEERKERWEAAVDSGEFSSIAELVRTSVSRELDGHHRLGTSGESAGDSASTPEATEEIVERLARIKSDVGDVQESVDRVEAETRVSGPIYDLEKVLLNYVLPEADPDEFQAEQGVSPAEIATEIEVDESTVQETLERLSEKTNEVQFGWIGEDEFRAYKRSDY